MDSKTTLKRQIWISRLTTLVLFAAASAVAILFVKQMLGWFIFINSALVTFLLPLAFFRFFWWRFNVWGELAAIILGLPMSILVWFVFDFQDATKHPIWQGLSLLFGLSFVVLIVTTLLTPAESTETLTKFYKLCRPPGFWRPIRAHVGLTTGPVPAFGGVLVNCALGILACLGLVLATNAIFVGDWFRLLGGTIMACLLGGWLVYRMFQPGGTRPRWAAKPDVDEKAIELVKSENKTTATKSL